MNFLNSSSAFGFLFSFHGGTLHEILFDYFQWLFLLYRENCSDKMEQFLERCFYYSGQYDSEEHFAELDKKLKAHEVMQAYSVL